MIYLVEVYLEKSFKPRGKVEHHKREQYGDKTNPVKNYKINLHSKYLLL